MDQSLLNVISHMQQIKHDLYQKHKPELIENPREVLRQPLGEKVPEKRSSAYDNLMREHKKIIYKKDRDAQQKAINVVETMDAQQHENQMRTRLSSTINFKSAKDELNDAGQIHELQKPWNKLTNSLKIRAMLKFIENISVLFHLTTDQINQLRYLLIAGINERHLCKLSEIDYDTEIGQIRIIHRLIFDGNVFKLAPQDAEDFAIGLKSFQIYPQLPISQQNLTTPSVTKLTTLPVAKLTQPPVVKLTTHEINPQKIKITLNRTN